MSAPLVSTIIPTYNRENTIRYCLDSVVNQTYRNLEIIIVDDCSSDKTIEIVESYGDSRIKIIRLDRNSGAQAARNRGIKAASADWVALLDSDDEWFLDKIERQVKVLEERGWEPFLVVHSDAVLFDTIGGTKKDFGIPKVEGKNVYPFLLTRAAPFFQAILTSQKAFEAIGYLDEGVPSYQEWDTSIRLAKVCEFIHLDSPTFTYYLHAGETISKNYRRDIQGYGYILDKFEKEIKRNCPENTWFNHLKIQYDKCVMWGFYDTALLYVKKMPFLKQFKYKQILKKKQRTDLLSD